jgi:hypothetical protein
MGRMRIPCKIMTGKPEGKDRFEDLGFMKQWNV